MAKKISGAKTSVSPVAAVYDRRTPDADLPGRSQTAATKPAKPSALLDTRVIYCGDNLEQLAKLPGPCRTGQYWGLPREITSRATHPRCLRRISRGETKEKRAFEDRHENTKAYIDYMRPPAWPKPLRRGEGPRCVQLARVLKQTGSFYYHCDWHASHYVKVMLDQILGENNFQNEIVLIS